MSLLEQSVQNKAKQNFSPYFFLTPGVLSKALKKEKVPIDLKINESKMEPLNDEEEEEEDEIDEWEEERKWIPRNSSKSDISNSSS